jgi:hypothetical protein
MASEQVHWYFNMLLLFYKVMCENLIFGSFTNCMILSILSRQNTRPTDDTSTEVKVDEVEPATGTGTHHEAQRASRELPPFRASNTWRLMSGPKRVITVIDEASV